MFFMSKEFGIMAEFGLGRRFIVVLGVRKHFLSVTDEFERNY